ncbi:MAG: DNA repair protein RadA [Pseudobdellovibrionaceae bacterium]
MAKSRTSYICQECGSVTTKWAGKCESCNAWNSIQEEVIEAGPPKGATHASGGKLRGKVLPFSDLKTKTTEKRERVTTGISELDRVCGGGLVAGMALLIGGDPGIGKSTILLQAVCALAKKGVSCAYVSGEEAVDQIRLRAERLGLDDAPVQLASAGNISDILVTMDQGGIDLIVIDSIQTMYVDTIDSAPGTVTQVRTSAMELIRMGKKKGICVMLVGHVTKEGQLAGPRVLEHMVDTVLYFEGERGHPFRILRAVKNRFGPTDEIGVFEMAEGGLREVKNPSALFLSQRQENVSGSAVLAAIEGTRPVLVEVQALVATTSFAAPRRAVVGWDSNRLSMILAVLEARCGLTFSDQDVYLNIAGGLRISEPGADLAVAAALISSLTGAIIPESLVFYGEVGLAGEIRPVLQMDLRAKEAAKLGFEESLCPKSISKDEKGAKSFGTPITHVSQLVSRLQMERKEHHAPLRQA